MTGDNNEPRRLADNQRESTHHEQQVAARHKQVRIKRMIRQDNPTARRASATEAASLASASGRSGCLMTTITIITGAAILAALLLVVVSAPLTLAAEPRAKSQTASNENANGKPTRPDTMLADNARQNMNPYPSSHQLQALAQDINSQLSPSPKRSQLSPALSSSSSFQGDSQPADVNGDESSLGETTSASSDFLASDLDSTGEPGVRSSSSAAPDDDETSPGGDEEAASEEPPEEPQHQHSRRQLDTSGEPATTRRPAPPTTTVATFNVGPDRMKPHEPIRIQFGPASSTSSSFGAPETSELATESVNHVMLSGHSQGDTDKSLINERRQDLLYPSNNQHPQHSQDSNARTINHVNDQAAISTSRQGDHFNNQELPGVASICYTPFALLMVILVTMLLTCLVCFCTHYLIRYLGRHQFDLVANSKHFDHKHSSGYLEGATNSRGNLVIPSSSSPFDNFRGAGQYDAARHHIDLDQHRAGHNNKCLMHLFQPDSNCNKCASARRRHSMMLMMANNNNNKSSSSPSDQQPLCLNSSSASSSSCPQQQQHQQAAHLADSCAFKNPYFTGDDLQARQQSSFSYEPSVIRTTEGAGPLAGDENFNPGQQQAAGGLLRTAPSNHHDQEQQLHFIEHHIANLHNRQVTSSVKELSILGNSPNAGHDDVVPLTTTQIVDLTCEQQRARVINNPREGDLIAVDISGHDIIGLGFDVCGNKHQGIFVKAVYANGPAGGSGCIQPGDRIKCLNISFDDVTLQDACDILNCGSPYKMRLLLEKKCLPAGVISKLNKLNGSSSDQRQGSAIKNATKSYLKRLTNRVVGAGDVGPDHHTHQQQQVARAEPPPLGSLQARQQLLQTRGNLRVDGESHFDDAGHTNEAFGPDDSSIGGGDGDGDHHDAGDHWRSQDELTAGHLMNRRPSRRMRSASGRASDRDGGPPADRNLKSSSTSGIDGSAGDVASGRAQVHKLRGPPISEHQVVDLSRVDQVGRHGETRPTQPDDRPEMTHGTSGRRTVGSTTDPTAKQLMAATTTSVAKRHSQSQPEISVETIRPPSGRGTQPVLDMDRDATDHIPDELRRRDTSDAQSYDQQQSSTTNVNQAAD